MINPGEYYRDRKNGREVKVMAIADNWLMVRVRRGTPFTEYKSDFEKRYTGPLSNSEQHPESEREGE